MSPDSVEHEIENSSRNLRENSSNPTGYETELNSSEELPIELNESRENGDVHQYLTRTSKSEIISDGTSGKKEKESGNLRVARARERKIYC